MQTEHDRYISPGLRDTPFPPMRTPQGPTPEMPTKKPGRPAPLEKLFKKSTSTLEVLNQQTGFNRGPLPKRKGHQLAAWSLVASVIDTLILLSLSCLFILAFSFLLRHAGLGSPHLQMNKTFEKIFFAVFLMCSWVYMVILRVLMGSSIGEWACDLRLGQPHERMKLQYPAKVIVRESLILITGIVTLPLFSLLLGSDIAGKLSGVRLFSLK